MFDINKCRGLIKHLQVSQRLSCSCYTMCFDKLNNSRCEAEYAPSGSTWAPRAAHAATRRAQRLRALGRDIPRRSAVSSHGCGSTVIRRGKPQVLVHVSTQQGNPFWHRFFRATATWNPKYKADRVSEPFLFFLRNLQKWRSGVAVSVETTSKSWLSFGNI